MKLITKHKDYYDWCVSIYGMDPIMVYDRRTSRLEKPSEYSSGETVEEFKFAICNKIFIVYTYGHKLYHTADDLVKLHHILKKDGVNNNFIAQHSSYYGWEPRNSKNKETLEQKAISIYEDDNNKDTDVNRITRQPVLILNKHSSDGEFISKINGEGKGYNTTWNLPDLSTYGFASWYPAEQMFQNVYAFISWLKDNPEIPNKQTNTEKVQSGGFDPKTSFRPKMK